MVDIHSHILPGLDDGAKDLAESLAMLRLAAESGTTDIVATPHANHDYRFQPERIEEKIAELEAAVGAAIRIHRGCDFHLTYDNIQEALAHPTKYAINHYRYVLVEFSDLLIPKSTEDVFYRMQAAGMVLIITHPERNPLLYRKLDQVGDWVAAGCLLQVTAHSLAGLFGRQAKEFAHRLLERNLVHFIASDAHDSEFRTPALKDAYDYVARKFGPARAEALLVTNPRATLTGDPVELPETEPPAPKKWCRFW